MKRFSLFLFVFSVSRICVHSTSSLDAEKRFIVVSGYKRSGLSYPEIQPTKPDSQPVLSRPMKKRICEDILSSYRYRQGKEIPLNTPNYYLWLNWLIKDFWPTETVKVKLDFEGEEYDEKGFVCTSDYRDFSELKYIISDEYNLNAIQPDLSHIPILARFVFFQNKEEWFIYSVAELPAEAYFSPDQGIERIYLQRRESQNQREDILCRLAEQNTWRICVAVLKSKYFEDKIRLNPASEVTTNCVQQSVSFQTETQATGRFKEWMLDCRSNATSHDIQFEYLLSYAYESDQIFVYVRRKESSQVFPESLTTNVRLRSQPTIQEFKEPERDKKEKNTD